MRNVLSIEHCGEKQRRNSPCRRTASCAQTARNFLPSSVPSSEYDQGLIISKSVMTTFYHDLNERKMNLKYSLFQRIRPFSCKIPEKHHFKNHVKGFQSMKLLRFNNYINFVSITFCKQNCLALPSSIFLKTGVKVATLSDNQLQNC